MAGRDSHLFEQEPADRWRWNKPLPSIALAAPVPLCAKFSRDGCGESVAGGTYESSHHPRPSDTVGTRELTLILCSLFNSCRPIEARWHHNLYAVLPTVSRICSRNGGSKIGCRWMQIPDLCRGVKTSASSGPAPIFYRA
jgi:hypothetical protein